MSAHAYDDEQRLRQNPARRDCRAHRLYEDEATFAIMDIMPRGRGPLSRHPEDSRRATFSTPIRTALPPVAVGAETGTGGRQGILGRRRDHPAVQRSRLRPVVFHLHFHVVPRFKGVPLKPPGRHDGGPAVLAANAEKIRAALADRLGICPPARETPKASIPAPRARVSPTMMPTSMRLPDSR